MKYVPSLTTTMTATLLSSSYICVSVSSIHNYIPKHTHAHTCFPVHFGTHAAASYRFSLESKFQRNSMKQSDVPLIKNTQICNLYMAVYSLHYTQFIQIDNLLFLFIWSSVRFLKKYLSAAMIMSIQRVRHIYLYLLLPSQAYTAATIALRSLCLYLVALSEESASN